MDYCPFARVVGMERVDATGGASPLPYEKREGWCKCKANRHIQMLALRKASVMVQSKG